MRAGQHEHDGVLFKCGCGQCIVEVKGWAWEDYNDKYDWENEVHISWYGWGPEGSLWGRIAWAFTCFWRVLTKGSFADHSVILNTSRARDFAAAVIQETERAENGTDGFHDNERRHERWGLALAFVDEFRREVYPANGMTVEDMLTPGAFEEHADKMKEICQEWHDYKSVGEAADCEDCGKPAYKAAKGPSLCVGCSWERREGGYGKKEEEHGS